MTNYERSNEGNGFKILAALSNLFIPGLGFAFYGDIGRFLKYLFIALIALIPSFGIIPLIMGLLAVYNVWTQQ